MNKTDETLRMFLWADTTVFARDQDDARLLLEENGVDAEAQKAHELDEVKGDVSNYEQLEEQGEHEKVTKSVEVWGRELGRCVFGPE